jgi:hypothetical protein
MRRIFLSLLAALLFVHATPRATRACLNEYVTLYVLRTATQRADRIETRLADGNASAAVRDASELFRVTADGQPVRTLDGETAWHVEWPADGSGDAPHTLPEADGRALAHRAALLFAIVLVRVDGNMTRAGGPARNVVAGLREENLAFAETLLAARARHPEFAEESLATLHRLGTAELLSDPFSWLALARLTHDETERAHALERCTATASRRGARRCVLTP